MNDCRSKKGGENGKKYVRLIHVVINKEKSVRREGKATQDIITSKSVLKPPTEGEAYVQPWTNKCY